MEISRGRRGNRGIEENTLAILDASGEKDSQHVDDDRVTFIEAVRASSIVSENGTPPTSKMYEAIFRILKDGKSLELIMASYHLLNELDKHFPRVNLSNVNNPDSSSGTKPEIALVKETWLPFSFGLDVCSERDAANRDSGGRIDSSGFNQLIQKLAEVAEGAKFYALETKFLANMLLFQYLVNVLEGDFLSRHSAYNETMNWTLLKDSLLNTLLGSRRINYKGLMKDCLSILCCVHAFQDLIYSEDSSARPFEKCNTSLEIAILEAGNFTSNAAQRLMVMIMELDVLKKKADMDGLTARADGVRTPLMEIILDELTYNKDFLSPFMQVFNEPKWKLEITLQYFWKYIAKPSVRTRRSNGSTDDTTIDGVLMCFSNINSTKSIIKKMGSVVAQLLLAHAFQAYLSLSSWPSAAKDTCAKENVGVGASLEICQKLISAFSCLKRTNRNLEILPLGKEALFIAATVISTKS